MLIVPLVILALILSWQDIKRNMVSIFALAGFCICSALWYLVHRKCDFKLFILLCILGFIYKIIVHKSVLGSADYILSFFLSPFLYNINFSILLMSLGFYGLVWDLYRKFKSDRNNRMRSYICVNCTTDDIRKKQCINDINNKEFNNINYNNKIPFIPGLIGSTLFVNLL